MRRNMGNVRDLNHTPRSSAIARNAEELALYVQGGMSALSADTIVGEPHLRRFWKENRRTLWLWSLLKL